MQGYRVGWPGWKTVARFGFPLVVKGKMFFDDKDKVWVATSDDFLPDHHFSCEADTFDELQKEITMMVMDTLDCVFENESFHRRNNTVIPRFETVSPLAYA